MENVHNVNNVFIRKPLITTKRGKEGEENGKIKENRSNRKKIKKIKREFNAQ